MEFWETKHSSEPGYDRTSSSWHPAQSCIPLLGLGKQAKLSSSPLISQQNWIPGRRLSPVVSMQCQKQLKSSLMYFGTTELPHSHDYNPQAFLPKLGWCFSLHGISAHIPFHTLLIPVTALSQNDRRPETEGDHLGALGLPDTSSQLRAGLAAESSVQSWASPRREISLMTIMGTELFKQENGLHSFFINITSKSNWSTCKKDHT